MIGGFVTVIVVFFVGLIPLFMAVGFSAIVRRFRG